MKSKVFYLKYKGKYFSDLCLDGDEHFIKYSDSKECAIPFYSWNHVKKFISFVSTFHNFNCKYFDLV